MPSPLSPPGAEGPELAEPPGFRRLRLMVTVLTATLTIGMMVIAATLVIRILMEEGPRPLSAPVAAEVAAPEGEAIIAVGAGPGALSLLTRDEAGVERLRTYHPETGAEIGVTLIRRSPGG